VELTTKNASAPDGVTIHETEALAFLWDQLR